MLMTEDYYYSKRDTSHTMRAEGTPHKQALVALVRAEKGIINREFQGCILGFSLKGACLVP